MSFRAALSSIALSATVALGMGPATTVALASDASGTQRYIAANYTLVRTARSYLRRAEAAPLKVLAQVKRDCPLAAANSPQDPQSTQLSDEVIGAMVLTAYHLDVPELWRFVAAVMPLRWSNARLTNTLRGYARKLKVLATLAPPDICADIRAWVASGYKTLPPSDDPLRLPLLTRLGGPRRTA